MQSSQKTVAQRLPHEEKIPQGNALRSIFLRVKSFVLYDVVFYFSNFRLTRIFINILDGKILYPNLGRALKLTKIKFLLCVVPNRGKPTAKSDKNQVKNVKNLKT